MFNLIPEELFKPLYDAEPLFKRLAQSEMAEESNNNDSAFGSVVPMKIEEEKGNSTKLEFEEKMIQFNKY